MADFARFSDRSIIAARPPKNDVDTRRPYAYLVEQERSPKGHVEDVATIFLTNRECPFRCLFCDLWKNTTDDRVPLGAIPEQIGFALSQLPAARHVKLYNSGNFFDHQAIPPEDYPAIALSVRDFETVIVENHPKLCGDDCLTFRDSIGGQLEVALGLETAHPEILPRLNKRMTLDDFQRATEFLRENDINVRAFILLKPPFMIEADAVEWAIRSIEFAFDCGVQCCSIIPTRAGNGIMDELHAAGDFSSPTIASIEAAHENGVALKRGRVFMDLWDIERFCPCRKCKPLRRERIRMMNDTQLVQHSVRCDCSGES